MVNIIKVQKSRCSDAFLRGEIRTRDMNSERGDKKNTKISERKDDGKCRKIAN